MSAVQAVYSAVLPPSLMVFFNWEKKTTIDQTKSCRQVRELILDSGPGILDFCSLDEKNTGQGEERKYLEKETIWLLEEISFSVGEE